MGKIMKACDDDKTLPPEIAQAVSGWMKELDEKKPEEESDDKKEEPNTDKNTTKTTS